MRRFCAASARSSAMTSGSVAAGGSASGSAAGCAAGTASSTSSSRLRAADDGEHLGPVVAATGRCAGRRTARRARARRGCGASGSTGHGRPPDACGVGALLQRPRPGASPSVTGGGSRRRSRVASPARSLCLRGSGEDCPFGAPVGCEGSPVRVHQQQPLRLGELVPRGVDGAAGRASGRGGAAQPVARAATGGELVAGAVSSRSPSARSLGSSASEPSTSRQTRPTAMPKTPWPPWTRSMTSSAEVHS